MLAVMIIPTGIGCEIGGHAGDATPAAKLLASVCDSLIVHPNVVNASDINEMTENMLYVEGSMLDRFLEGEIELKETRDHNKILVVVNPPVPNAVVNAVSAARVTLGMDATILELKTPLIMKARYAEDGRASGDVTGWEELAEQVAHYNFDALAVVSLIDVSKKIAENYWINGGVNPWGGVEAIASKLIATALNKPVAHAPILEQDVVTDVLESDYIVDPRMGAEIISWAMLHCVLKGLHKAPQIGKGISVDDVDVMISPFGCWGRPHDACEEAGIPIIVVKENTCVLEQATGDDAIMVKNYLEAAGFIAAMSAGILPESVRRPLEKTRILQ